MFDDIALVVDGDGASTSGSSWKTPNPVWRLGTTPIAVFNSISKLLPTVLVTNRPPVTVEGLLYEVGTCRLGIAESGGSFVIPGHSRSVITNPLYENFRTHKRQLIVNAVNEVREKMGIIEEIQPAPSYEIAMCYYPTRAKAVSSEFVNNVDEILKNRGLDSLVYLSPGEALDIFPMQPRPLDKSIAADFIPELYKVAYNADFPGTIIAGGDSKTDIPMFEGLRNYANEVICVTNANASKEVKEYVRSQGGIVSEKHFGAGIEAAVSEVLGKRSGHPENSNYVSRL